MDKGMLVELIDYHCWANDKLLAAIEVLSAEQFARKVGGTFPSIRETLVHMLNVEASWLERVQGDAVEIIKPQDLHDAAAARELWRVYEARLRGHVDALAPDALVEAITMPWLHGDVLQMRRFEPLLHVVNHGTYHRGQLSNQIRQVGGRSVSTDLLYYLRPDLYPTDKQ